MTNSRRKSQFTVEECLKFSHHSNFNDLFVFQTQYYGCYGKPWYCLPAVTHSASFVFSAATGSCFWKIIMIKEQQDVKYTSDILLVGNVNVYPCLSIDGFVLLEL